MKILNHLYFVQISYSNPNKKLSKTIYINQDDKKPEQLREKLRQHQACRVCESKVICIRFNMVRAWSEKNVVKSRVRPNFVYTRNDHQPI